MSKKRLAIVVGGWHYPYEFYKQIKAQKIPENWDVDYFVVSHRNPELKNVFDEKQPVLQNMGEGLLQKFDIELYSRIITKQELKDMGFTYNEEENSIGDLNQLAQWTERHYEGQYNKVLFIHDDTYMLSDEMIVDILEQKAQLFLTTRDGGGPVNIKEVSLDSDWVHLGASQHYGNTIVPRMSYVFVDSKLLDHIKPHFAEIINKNITLNRKGKTDTVSIVDGQVTKLGTADWNHMPRNFINWILDNGYGDKSLKLSDVYRVNKYLIEGERGMMWNKDEEHMVLNNISKYYDISNEVQ